MQRAGTAPTAGGTREGTPAPGSPGDSGGSCSVLLGLFWNKEQKSSARAGLSPALPAGTNPGWGRAGGAEQPGALAGRSGDRSELCPRSSGDSQRRAQRSGQSRDGIPVSTFCPSRAELCSPSARISREWDQRHPVLRLFLTPSSPTSHCPPWGSGPFLPSELSAERPRCHCPPLVAPQTHPRGAWPGRSNQSLEETPEMGSVLTLDVACPGQQPRAGALRLTPGEGHSSQRGMANSTVLDTRLISNFPPKQQEQEGVKSLWTYLQPEERTVSDSRACKNPPGEIPPIFQGQDEGISGWEGLLDLHA